MRPKNDREREVLQLSERLPRLTKAQYGWINRCVVPKVIHTSGHACWCSECGGGWSESRALEGAYSVCPHCGSICHISKDRKRSGEGMEYIQILQVFHGWQVIRYILVEWKFEKGKEAKVYTYEVIQKWCQPGKPSITLGRNLCGYPYQVRVPFSRYSRLAIKDGLNYWHSEWMEVKVYPNVSLLKPYKKAMGGHIRFPDDIDADTLFAQIFSVPYFEALLKAGELDRLKKCLNFTREFNKYWPSVRVALRHGYQITDLASYFDHLKALRFLNYDMRSPRYVAPPDFAELHDLITRQYQNRLNKMNEARQLKEEIARAEELEREIERAKEDAAKHERSLAKRMERFDGFKIVAQGIYIIPLMTIQDFVDEGEAMHHCVFRMGYYKKPDSLILSARDDDGKRIETIEVDIQTFTVRQSQGFADAPTKFHDQILGMVKGAMPRIRRIVQPKRRRAAS